MLRRIATTEITINPITYNMSLSPFVIVLQTYYVNTSHVSFQFPYQ